MVAPVRDDGPNGAGHVLVGIFGVGSHDILVEKATGNISWIGGPTITNWSRLWQ